MVLDPLSAISLAGNIVQFVDFASKVVSKSKQILSNGAASENLALEDVTGKLLDIVSRLKKQAEVAPTSGCLTKDDQMLDYLTSNCIAAGEVLLSKLQELKIPNNTRHPKWKSLRQGLKTVWDKRKLEAFAARLANFRSQLELGIMLALKKDMRNIQLQDNDQYARLSIQFRELSDTIGSDQAERMEKQTSAISEHVDHQASLFTGLCKDTVAQIFEHQERLPEKLAEACAKSILENTQSVNFEAYKDQVKKDNEQVDRAVLRRLKFSSLYDRYDRVADAQKKTFEWIFRDPKTWNKPWSDFSHWLSKSEAFYWISGKAGSGKSTLMRYLVESTTTQRLLEEWAGAEMLTVACFFFWNGGAPEQASQTGLVRSLLYELLDKTHITYPDLIRRVFPNEWADAKDAVLAKKHRARSKQKFSHGRLKKALRFFAEQDIGRVCLFVDGLDGFNGDATDMRQLFRLISSENVKMCLSSRPWVVFEDAFHEQPKLRLQDLTFGDIGLYVKDKLFSNQRMKSLQDSRPQESSWLVTDIVRKASGVFLWVMLVVRDLLKGLTSYDKFPALQQRIQALPSELRDLYHTMVRQIEPRYLQEGSRILQMMSLSRSLAKEASRNQQLCSAESLCAVGLSFVMEENPIPDMKLINFGASLSKGTRDRLLAQSVLQ